MLTRPLFGCLLVAMSLAWAPGSTAHAYARVIKQQSNGAGSIYITGLGLIAGHRYRIDVTSPARHPAFTGQALSDYVYVANRSLHTALKPMYLSGTAPHSFTLRQQISGRVNQWALSIEVQLKSPHKVTVRVVDLGHA